MSPPGSASLGTGEVGRNGIGHVGIIGEGRLAWATDVAVALLAGNGAKVEGQPLVRYLEPAGREWVDRCLQRGGLGIEEQPVRTVANVAVRFWPLANQEFLLLEDSAHAALDHERESHRCDDARSQLAAAVARDLNDPMSIVQGRLELLLELGGPETEALSRHLRIALDHARRVSSTLHLLRLVGGPTSGGGRTTTARKLLLDACQDVEGAELRLEMHPKNLGLYGPPDLLRQVLVGLVGRVRDAASRGLQARAVGREEAGHAILELRAEAVGAEHATPVRVSSDPRLDIGVSAHVLGRIGGRLEAYKIGRGLLFRLVLPQAAPWTPSDGATRGAAIVVGLDAPTDLCALMAQEGFDATCVEDGESALAALETQEPVAVVASMLLPGISGLALLRSACERWLRLKGRAVLVCRGTPGGVPDGVAVCTLPLDRLALMRGLGVNGAGRRR